MEQPTDAAGTLRAVRDVVGALRARRSTAAPSRSRARRARRRGRRASRLWLRVVAIFALFVAAPGSAQLVQDIAAAAVDCDGCDPGCDSGASDCCPASCAHCVCCVHASAVAAGALALPGAPRPELLTMSWWTSEADAAGYHAPPFRPPAA